MTNDTTTPSTWYETTRVSHPERERLNHDLDVDVCVIGAGLAGLTAAREVALRGWSVVVLEGAQVGAAASCRNTGFVLPGFSEGIAPPAAHQTRHVATPAASMAGWVRSVSSRSSLGPC